MRTPIVDFVRTYAEKNALRLHMPGHKGKGALGIEALDLTEIEGADSLYEAEGIIKESEDNASKLFGCKTYYSTEGSSLCIRAMLYLLTLYAREKGVRAHILAGRNAHKTFLSACAMLDTEVTWLSGDKKSYLSCSVSPLELEKAISSAPVKPIAVYITSPDYLGNVSDVKALAEVCHAHGVLLCVDNAHGAYLRFLTPSLHPIDLGADICCDSAHKTLSVLTGGAYLHLTRNCPNVFSECAKDALAAFGSTSPSYLILQSLDAANEYLANGYTERLYEFSLLVRECKNELTAHGYTFVGDEPLKLTVMTKPYGYSGYGFADILKQNGIVSEFADPDYTVLMLTPEIGEEGLDRLTNVMKNIPMIAPVTNETPSPVKLKQSLSIREAYLSPSETLPISECVGRTLARATVGCPPAVPIAVSGEIIDEAALKAFEYYNIKTCTVVK